jgi:hypothetical protein
MRKVLSIFIAACLVLSLFTNILAPVPSARALTEGDFTYSLAGTAPDQTATITGYTGPGGAVVIPSTIGAGPYPVTEIGDSAFDSTQGHLVTSVTIPNSVNTIGYNAFQDCAVLTSVAIPDSVIVIDGAAFYGCTGLTSVTIPDSVIFIDSNAFTGCSGLTSLTIGNSLTGIGYAVFSGCAALTSVTIPNSVTSIGQFAFSSCTGLTSVTVGSGVTTIGDRAFYWCAALTAAYFLGNAPTMSTDVFASSATGFTVWYVSGTTGWTNPWYGYPTATFSATLMLSSSWNLVSVAVPLPVASITGLQAVYGYHDAWSVPTTLTPGEAYWVQVEHGVTVPLYGTPSTLPVPITYQSGWQLLGNPFDVPVPITSITNHELITSCYSYSPAWGVLNTATESLQPGKGYWINLSAATTLTLTHP